MNKKKKTQYSLMQKKITENKHGFCDTNCSLCEEINSVCEYYYKVKRYKEEKTRFYEREDVTYEYDKRQGESITEGTLYGWDGLYDFDEYYSFEEERYIKEL